MKTKEIFSHFIHKSLSDYLAVGGFLNLVLPVSILAVDKHKEIRSYILNAFSVKNVYFYGKTFDGVFTDIVVVDMIKSPASSLHEVVFHEKNVSKILQSSLVKNNYTLSVVSQDMLEVFDKYKKLPHITLKDSVFALGIVTGNNSFFLSEVGQGSDLKIISGKELLPGKIISNKLKFIKNTPEKFQQAPPMSLFLEKKIVYKFISKKIVSAVDESGSLTLNSANFIIVKNTGLPEEYVSAILNSSIINELYMKKNGAPLKVLKKALQDLPIFIFKKALIAKIVKNYKNGNHGLNDKIISDEVALLLKNL
jgi:hypothetical protein